MRLLQQTASLPNVLAQVDDAKGLRSPPFSGFKNDRPVRSRGELVRSKVVVRLRLEQPSFSGLPILSQGIALPGTRLLKGGAVNRLGGREPHLSA